ncbi:MAG: GNAT family N-acetyltransferase [Anaerolineae bacterium]|nr:GNAT family N-acetyltransferase [Anaerolineae bacterium]
MGQLSLRQSTDTLWTLRRLETPEDMAAVEELQRYIWPGSETDVVPAHLLLTVAHNGGLVMGAFVEDTLVGFVFGFPGLESTSSGIRVKQCSHMLGVHPDYRDRGLGFTLKRAQWRAVREQGLDHVTWTYDPLLSRNARLNIAKLGAVCNTYLREVYGVMRDALNAGLPSDRFQVDWWVNSRRVEDRLNGGLHPQRGLADYLGMGGRVLNAAKWDDQGWPRPPEESAPLPTDDPARPLLVEIPADFLSMKAEQPDLALTWRLHTRSLFEELFASGYVVTEFVHEAGPPPRSLYVLTHGAREA